MATTIQESGREIALVDIRVPDNVRDLDPRTRQGVRGLDRAAGHARLIVVRNDREGFELVAGLRRIAAARSLALEVVPAVVRDAVTEDAVSGQG